MFWYQHADSAADAVLEQWHVGIANMLGKQHAAQPGMLGQRHRNVGVGNPDVLNEQHLAADGMCSNQRYVVRERVRDQPRIGVRRDRVKHRASSTGILNVTHHVTGDSQRGWRYRHTVGAE